MREEGASHPDEHGYGVTADDVPGGIGTVLRKCEEDERSRTDPRHNNGIDAPDKGERDAQE